MSPETDSPLFPLSLKERVDRVCVDFEKACQSGQRPALEPIVAACPEEERGPLLTELLLVEWTYRQHEHAVFSPEEYGNRFGPLQAVVEKAWQRWQETQGRAETVVSAQQSTVLPRSNRSTVAPLLPRPQAGHEQMTLLGRGGMGEVYRAFDPTLKRWVALKRVRLEQIDPEGLRRFRLEAEALARLTHPHIVKVHGFGERDGQPLLEMEYVAGGTLEQRLGKQPLPPAEAARLVAILAWAVHAAHEKGIVHRDLKPANILMDDPVPGNPCNVLDGFPKITDFGLAALSGASSGQTLSGAILGTPAYMSPEQATGKASAIGPPTDIWALGVILYRCLTGNLPFAGDSVLDTLERVRTLEIRPLLKRQTGLSPELVDTCLACLARSPEERPTAAQLAQRLELWPGKGEAAVRPVRPRRRWGRAAAAVAVLCLLGAGLWWLLARNAPGASSGEGERANPVSAANSAPLDVKLVLDHWVADSDGEAFYQGVMGTQSFESRFDDGIVVKVSLSQPGYCYVLECNTNGQIQLLWPRTEGDGSRVDPNRLPPLLTSFVCPPQPKASSSASTNLLRLRDRKSGGMQGFLVVASRRPLPAYRDWISKLPEAPWRHIAPRPGVFRSNGDTLEALSPRTRSIEEAMPSAVPVQNLCVWARTPEVDTVMALLFPVFPHKAPGEEP